jgi:carbamoyl-phosphate synthase large subunit
MENLDPMGIHTGESTVVTPSQVIPDQGHQDMRTAAIDVIRDLGIHGGCNIQFAWRDDGTPGGEYRVVEVNPRVSRSSALASKATGYPIARVTAKVAMGKRLHEIENEITGETTAAFEPAIDYVVTKVPRWPADKFPDVEFELGPAMKSTGEAMAIGRTFEESLAKALRSTEYDPAVDLRSVGADRLHADFLDRPCPERPYAVLEAFRRGASVADLRARTGIREWYLERFRNLAEAMDEAAAGEFRRATELGFTNAQAAAMRSESGDTVADGGEAVETAEGVAPDRVYKQVDTCAGEFEASTPYYYSSRSPGPTPTDREELRVDRDARSVVIVGGGPIRIGQGVEFDYCTVHAVRALRETGIEAHVVNNNPETVSTDYDTSDGLFFEPITAEEVADVVEATDADGVMVQFGGQTSVDVGAPLAAELDRRGLDCSVLGTDVEAMDLAEDRDRFNLLMDELGIAQPEGGAAKSETDALELARKIGYPVLVRPSYVLGGRAMEVVSDDDELRSYVREAVRVSPEKPVLIDEFLAGAVELDVDAVADGEDVLIGGVMEHVEPAGVHSGDSACVIPPRSLDDATMARVREVVEEVAVALETVGLLNVQLAVAPDGEVYVLEANPRSSRTVPFVSKATGVPIAKLAARVMAGASLAELAAGEQVPERASVKEVVLPFDRLPDSDPRLGPEMKSTGEVMGTADDFAGAYRTAQVAAGAFPETGGSAVVDIDFSNSNSGSDPGSDLGEYFSIESPEDVSAALRSGEVDLLVSNDPVALQVAVEEEVPYCSTPASAEALVEALAASPDVERDVRPLDERSVTVRRWGAPTED